MRTTRNLINRFYTCGLDAHELRTLRRRFALCRFVKRSALVTLWTAFAGAIALLGGSVVAMIVNFWVL